MRQALLGIHLLLIINGFWNGLWNGLGIFVYASPPVSPASQSVPCGVLEGFGGQVQIIDSTRTQLTEPTYRANIQCGDWISVAKGWAQFHHREGYLINLGSQTFVQVSASDTKVSAEFMGDQVTLYQGSLYGRAEAGDGEFKILTANSRIRLKQAVGLVIFSKKDDLTQLISLSGTSSIENRFEPTRKIQASPGEASSLDLNTKTVLPTMPRAIFIASLKEKLADLHLNENEQREAIQAAQQRQERKFAIEEPKMPSREISSVYQRHDSIQAKEMLHSHLLKKQVGGIEKDSHSLLYPEKYDGQSQKAQVNVIDPSSEMERKVKAAEDAEKRRLMEELSKISLE